MPGQLHRFDDAERIGFPQGKARRFLPDQFLHQAAAAEFPSDIVTERADVGAFGTAHPKRNARQMDAQDLQLVNTDLAFAAFGFDALPRQINQFSSADFPRGIHRRQLPAFSRKGHDRSPDFFLRAGDQVMSKHFSAGILRIGLRTEIQHGPVHFRPFRQQIGQFRGPSEQHRQYAFRFRIQGPQMTYFLLSEDPAQTRNGIKGSIAFFFSYDQDSVHAPISSPISLVMIFADSCHGPFMSKPAACSWPPPPWEAARPETLMCCERRLTL